MTKKSISRKINKDRSATLTNQTPDVEEAANDVSPTENPSEEAPTPDDASEQEHHDTLKSVDAGYDDCHPAPAFYDGIMAKASYSKAVKMLKPLEPNKFSQVKFPYDSRLMVIAHVSVTSYEEERHEVTGRAKKGVTIRADSDIEAGAVILAERPEITMARDMMPTEENLATLRRVVKELDDVHKVYLTLLYGAGAREKSPDAIFDLFFCYAIDFGHPTKVGMFIYHSLLEVACNPNTVSFWDYEKQALVTTAVQGIKKGEEVTRAFLNQARLYSERLLEHHAAFGKHCGCNVCDGSVTVMKRRQAHRRDALETAEFIRQQNLGSPIRTLQALAHFHLTSLGQDFPAATELRPVCDAMELCLRTNDHQRAIYFALLMKLIMAHRLPQEWSGDFASWDLYSTIMDVLPEDFGWSAQVPQDTVEFKRWLYRLGETPEPLDEERLYTNCADLTDEDHFPRVDDLPTCHVGDSQRFDPEYFEFDQDDPDAIPEPKKM